MKIHYIQHASFEHLGSMEVFLRDRGHALSSTHIYAGEVLPPLDTFDWLIIMGGPMNIYHEEAHPWLRVEKTFIKSAIDAGKTALGICLGAQLIADVLGAKVNKHTHTEIGWHEISRTDVVQETSLASAIPKHIHVFQWHEDMFEIPEGAVALARSEACQNQGFIFQDRVLALQFHLEMTQELTETFISNFNNDLDDSHYVQSACQMLLDNQKFIDNEKMMCEILNCMEMVAKQS